MWILLLTCFLYFCYYRHHCCDHSTTYQDTLAPHLGMTLHHMEILVEMAAKNCCLILGKMILHQMEILVHTAVTDCCFVLENPIMKYVCVILYSKKQMTCYVLCNAMLTTGPLTHIFKILFPKFLFNIISSSMRCSLKWSHHFRSSN